MVSENLPEASLAHLMVPFSKDWVQPLAASPFSGAVGRPSSLSRPPPLAHVSPIFPISGTAPLSLELAIQPLAKVAREPFSPSANSVSLPKVPFSPPSLSHAVLISLGSSTSSPLAV